MMPSMCEIKFENAKTEERAIAELLAIRDTLKIVQDGHYVVTKKECEYLIKKKIPHKIISEF